MSERAGTTNPDADPSPNREASVRDRHRPIYHFGPPTGWMNDPNGLLQIDGRTHLFYQHNPAGGFHHNIHWGHAVSDDLVHWEHLPIALTPDPGGPDKDGCWSGCAVVQDGTPTLIYTGLSPQVQCLATSEDGLVTWQKWGGNPFLAGPPPELDIIGSTPEIRDPWVWSEDGRWHMLLGSGVRRGETGGLRTPEGVLLLYRSDDLRTWEYVGVAHRGRFAANSAIWECPNLFRIDDQHVLLVSEQYEFKHTYYQVGTFDGRRFVPKRTGKTDHGKYFYAALTMEDAGERRLMWGWIKEGRTEEAQRDAGWSGVLSLPRVLGLHRDGSLAMRPAPELDTLRYEAHALSSRRMASGTEVSIPQLRGDALELRVRATVLPGATLTIALRQSPDRTEQTLVHYRRASEELVLDTTRSSLSPDVTPERVEVHHALTDDSIELRVFLDRSVIEVFADDRTCVTGRLYPSKSDSLEVSLVSSGGETELRAFTGWRMRSIR